MSRELKTQIMTYYRDIAERLSRSGRHMKRGSSSRILQPRNLRFLTVDQIQNIRLQPLGMQHVGLRLPVLVRLNRQHVSPNLNLSFKTCGAIWVSLRSP